MSVGNLLTMHECRDVRQRRLNIANYMPGTTEELIAYGSHANPGSDSFLLFTVDGSGSTGYQLEYLSNELEIAPAANASILVPSTTVVELWPRAIDRYRHAARNSRSFQRHHDQHRGHGLGAHRRFARRYDHVRNRIGGRLHHHLAELDRKRGLTGGLGAHGDTVVVQNIGDSGSGPSGTAGPRRPGISKARPTWPSAAAWSRSGRSMRPLLPSCRAPGKEVITRAMRQRPGHFRLQLSRRRQRQP